MHNTNLLGVNSKDLSESLCLIVTKFFFITTSLSSLIWYVFMFLSLYDLMHTDAKRRSRSFLWWWWTPATGASPKARRPKARRRRAMTHHFV